MRPLPDTPEPYRVRLSIEAGRQAAQLAPVSRDRLGRRLLDLADMAAFAAGYLLSVTHLESLVSESEGVSIKYEIDDGARTLTVREIVAEKPTAR